uniref:Uncharacterized protein n=1 Tax=Parascaris univalens TaxID=6257 RepID=A0A915AYK6_PARUN
MPLLSLSISPKRHCPIHRTLYFSFSRSRSPTNMKMFLFRLPKFIAE